MIARDEVIAKIKALRARAGDAASSEAEAETAARIAAKIIAQHNVDERELIERGVAGLVESAHNKGRSRVHPALKECAYDIGQLTKCAALFNHGENCWVGQPEDVAYALYLCELVQGASERSYAWHWRERWNSAPIRAYRNSYLMGFGQRCALRFRAMRYERDEARAETATGTNLVVVKSALIEAHLSDRNIRTAREGKPKINTRALLAGHRDAGHFNVARPIESEDQAEGIEA